jgi:hypothetical protein
LTIGVCDPTDQSPPILADLGAELDAISHSSDQLMALANAVEGIELV